ncbi:hypothetical protein C4K08_1479 [Pseudomonas chlororaphis subsp. aureofaciens]|nr:hypothetical protein C4K08_1479 [Pseudomonas chlororaphis subsp. aureofaciens]
MELFGKGEQVLRVLFKVSIYQEYFSPLEWERPVIIAL